MRKSISFLAWVIILLGSSTNSVYGQKDARKYEATVFYVSGFKEKGLLEEVRASGVIVNQQGLSRLIEAGSIRKISVKPYRSGRRALFVGALAGVAGVGLSYNIQRGYGQKVGKGTLPVLILSAAAITGGYFWVMNSTIQTSVFRDVNHPENFQKYRGRLERFSLKQEH